MKKIFLTFIIGLSLLSSVFVLNPVKSYAQSNADNFELTVAVKNPLGDKKEFKDILSSVLKAIMDIVLPIVIVMVIYSGFLYVMARGKPDAIEKAHKTLTWTLIGAAILLGAQLIATVLVDTVSNIGRDSGVTSRRNSSSGNVNNITNTGGATGGTTTTGGASAGTNINTGGTSAGINTTAGVTTSGNTTGGTTTFGVTTTGGLVSGATTTTGGLTGSVQTTKYYVNATNGANLRSAPNLTSSYTTQPYGTVLNVSGETNGFYNIYNTSNTSIIGYIAKDLLTLGSVAPAQSGASSSGSGSQSNIGKISIKSQYPFSGVTRTYLSVEVLNTFTPWGGYLSFECKDQNNQVFNSPNITKTNVGTLKKGSSIDSFELDIKPVGIYTCRAFYYGSSSGADKRYTNNSVKITVK